MIRPVGRVGNPPGQFVVEDLEMGQAGGQAGGQPGQLVVVKHGDGSGWGAGWESVPVSWLFRRSRWVRWVRALRSGIGPGQVVVAEVRGLNNLRSLPNSGGMVPVRLLSPSSEFEHPPTDINTVVCAPPDADPVQVLQAGGVGDGVGVGPFVGPVVGRISIGLARPGVATGRRVERLQYLPLVHGFHD